MIRWTSSGVVGYPKAVQIRLTKNYPSRIAGKAPQPSRELSPSELLNNIEYFTTGLKTPRTRPCNRLILSGIQEHQRSSIEQVIFSLVKYEMAQLVLHIPPNELKFFIEIENTTQSDLKYVCSIKTLNDLIKTAPLASTETTLSIMLNTEVLSNWDTCIEQLRMSSLDTVVFHYPYPGANEKPEYDLSLLISKLELVKKAFENSPLKIFCKGLPICYLHPLDFSYQQTQNRWYVDADHQKEEALLFLPDVIQYHKADSCRFCSFDSKCDGFFLSHLKTGQFPHLRDPLFPNLQSSDFRP